MAARWDVRAASKPTAIGAMSKEEVDAELATAQNHINKIRSEVKRLDFMLMLIFMVNYLM